MLGYVLQLIGISDLGPLQRREPTCTVENKEQNTVFFTFLIDGFSSLASLRAATKKSFLLVYVVTDVLVTNSDKTHGGLHWRFLQVAHVGGRK